MRKLILTTFLSVLGFVAFGQNSINMGVPFMAPNSHVLNSAALSNLNPGFPAMNKTSVKVSEWYSYTAALADSFASIFTNNNYLQTVYTDTFVKIVNKPTTGAVTSNYQFLNAIGTMFDPADSVYIFANGLDSAIRPLSRKESYSIDSVAIPYIYRRNIDSAFSHDSTYKDSIALGGGKYKDTTITVKKYSKVVDTLFVQVAGAPSSTNLYNWTTTKEIFATYDFDVKKGLGVGMTTYTILLTNKDTSNRNYAFKFLPVGSTNVAGVVFTYKSGTSVKRGDTLVVYGDTSIHPKKKMNTFYFNLRVDPTNRALKNAYSNGLTMQSFLRYRNKQWTDSNTAGQKYYPTNIPNATGYWYPNMLFKVTHDLAIATGIEKPNYEGYALGNVYPNPVTGGVSNLEFALGKNSSVTINVYDIVGQKVMNVTSGMYTSGNHKVSITTETLKPGMYFYTINANGFSQTKKFTVAQ